MTGALILAVALAIPQGAGALPPGSGTRGAMQTPAAEVIAEVRIHGNHVSTNDEVLALSGIAIGDPFTATTIGEVTARLRASGRFDDVGVLKRFASIEDASRIVLVIIVNEGPVRLTMGRGPEGQILAVRRRGLRNLMYMPILDAEDGYGLTWGVRVARVNWIGERSRVSFPLTWGGTRQAGVEFDRTFPEGALSRVQVGASVRRQRNPGFDVHDSRRRIWARAERNLFSARLRAGGTVSWEHVAFADLDDDLRAVGADLVFDTRIDPLMPRNAVFARAAWERVSFASGGAVQRRRVDGRVFVGLIGQSVLVVQAARDDASDPLPPYLQPLLGGWSNLRGFRAGSFVGDTRVTGSTELRVPLTSALSVGRIGVSAFVDTGTVYSHHERFQSSRLRTGIGGSVWLTATAFQLSLSVAHGRGADTRVNFGGGFVF